LKEQKVFRAIKPAILTTIFAGLALTFAACGSAGSSGSGSTPGATDVAASVNGKNIMLSEVDKLINQQFQGQQAQMSQLQLAQARLQALDVLIRDEILSQRAEREKLVPTEEEVTQFVNNLKQQGQMTEEQFQKSLKDANQTEATLREATRKQIAIQKLQDKINSKITISDKEVEDTYNGNKDQFINKRGVQLAAIIVDPTDNGLQNDAKSDLEAKQKIDLISQELKSEDFAKVAREKSEDPNSGPNGGDIGFATEDDLKQNNFPPSLIGEFFGSMAVGSYSPPVQFNNKWYIFKLQAKQLQNENLTLESPGVRQRITNVLLNQRKQILNDALLKVALSEAKVVNNLAADMLVSPNKMSGLRPAPAANASPAAGAAASPAASATPRATTSPAATTSPSK
jgi:peptidyl-prolyl cis-trans isomerase SurA